MCTLYSITTNQAAIAGLFRVINQNVGNLPPMPGVFPDYPAPVVRNAGAERELIMMRWGMPPPRTGGPPITNIRNTSSSHWRGWLKTENRLLVPFNSFAEGAPEPNPETRKKDPAVVARKPEIASATEAVQDARIHIELINGPFLLKEGGTPPGYGAGLKLAVDRGWLWRHGSGTYVRFTQAAAELFA